MIIPYVAFLFKVFASYQKNEAYIKSVERSLQLAGKHARWIMEYDGQARALKEWMDAMTGAFSETDHGTDLDQIRAAIANFSNYRRAEKPSRREHLTQLGGHLNMLNASCRNNKRPEYVPEPELAIPALEGDWTRLQDNEGAYSTSLQDAYSKFLQLEAALNSFEAQAGEVATFATEAAAAIEGAELGADIDAIEQQINVANATDSKVASRLEIVGHDLVPLVEQLQRGGHAQATPCEERLAQLRGELEAVSAENGTWRDTLAAELERQRTIGAHEGRRDADVAARIAHGDGAGAPRRGDSRTEVVGRAAAPWRRGKHALFCHRRLRRRHRGGGSRRRHGVSEHDGEEMASLCWRSLPLTARLRVLWTIAYAIGRRRRRWGRVARY